ncbi:MAG: 4-alpha-glucanotransferase [Balneolales bacterium]
MKFPRSCGILVHPTSFPSPYGIGDLGQEAKNFINFLVSTHQSVWQMLPLGPTGFGESPYASYSAFAGNHYLISPDILLEKGLINNNELANGKSTPTTQVNYSKAYQFKDGIFDLACVRFYKDSKASTIKSFEIFKKKNAYWLDDYVLFMACMTHYGQKPWNTWEKGLVMRDKKTMDKFRERLKAIVDLHYWLQFEFFEQWFALRKYANDHQILVIGDIPIFVDHNSSDVWSKPGFFELDETGNRRLVSGVPPDYFSDTGQLWGNPLYKWSAMEEDGYSWWVERFSQMFKLFDAMRVDHFRGFDAFWEIQAGAPTAENGRWVKGPGEKLFDVIQSKLGRLPIIAEDLGVITHDVLELRDKFDFPGMKVLQFSFSGDSANSFLPHNYKSTNSIVYTGTHDNDTTLGWYEQAPEIEKHRVREYLNTDGNEINWDLIRLAMFSVANQAIFPLQDLMSLKSDHRMNFPGTVEGNWLWRYTSEMLDRIEKERIRKYTEMTNRNPRNNRKDINMSEIEDQDVN